MIVVMLFDLYAILQIVKTRRYTCRLPETQGQGYKGWYCCSATAEQELEKEEESPTFTSSRVKYERHVTFLQRSYQSKKWSVSSVMTLIEQTSQIRRQWICDDKLSIKEVFHEFPCLVDVNTYVYLAFCS